MSYFEGLFYTLLYSVYLNSLFLSHFLPLFYISRLSVETKRLFRAHRQISRQYSDESDKIEL